MQPALRKSLIASFIAAACGGGWMAWDAFEDHLVEVSKGSMSAPGPKPIAEANNQVPQPPEATATDEPVKELIVAEQPQTEGPSDRLLQAQHELWNCRDVQDAKEAFRLFQQSPVDDYQKWKYLSESSKVEKAALMPMDDMRKLLSFHARAAIRHMVQKIRSAPDDHMSNSTRYFRIALLLENDASADIGLPHAEAELGITKDFTRKEFYRLIPFAEQQALVKFRDFPIDTLTPNSSAEKQYLELYRELGAINPHLSRNIENYAAILWERAHMTPEQADAFFSRAHNISESRRLEREAHEMHVAEEQARTDPEPQLVDVRQLLQSCQGPR